jgi:uncharacterized membrane protein
MKRYLLVLIIFIGLGIVVFEPSGSLSFMIWYILILAILRGAHHLEGSILLEKKWYYIVFSIFISAILLLLILNMNNVYNALLIVPFDKTVLTLVLFFLLIDIKPKEKVNR